MFLTWKGHMNLDLILNLPKIPEPIPESGQIEKSYHRKYLQASIIEAS